MPEQFGHCTQRRLYDGFFRRRVCVTYRATPHVGQRSLLRMVRRRWLPGADETDDALLSRLVTWARRALGDSSADLLASAD